MEAGPESGAADGAAGCPVPRRTQGPPAGVVAEAHFAPPRPPRLVTAGWGSGQPAVGTAERRLPTAAPRGGRWRRGHERAVARPTCACRSGARGPGRDAGRPDPGPRPGSGPTQHRHHGLSPAASPRHDLRAARASDLSPLPGVGPRGTPGGGTGTGLDGRSAHPGHGRSPAAATACVQAPRPGPPLRLTGAGDPGRRRGGRGPASRAAGAGQSIPFRR